MTQPRIELPEEDFFRAYISRLCDFIVGRNSQKGNSDGLCKQAKNDEKIFYLGEQNCLFRKFPKRKF